MQMNSEFDKKVTAARAKMKRKIMEAQIAGLLTATGCFELPVAFEIAKEYDTKTHKVSGPTQGGIVEITWRAKTHFKPYHSKDCRCQRCVSAIFQ